MPSSGSGCREPFAALAANRRNRNRARQLQSQNPILPIQQSPAWGRPRNRPLGEPTWLERLPAIVANTHWRQT